MPRGAIHDETEDDATRKQGSWVVPVFFRNSAAAALTNQRTACHKCEVYWGVQSIYHTRKGADFSLSPPRSHTRSMMSANYGPKGAFSFRPRLEVYMGSSTHLSYQKGCRLLTFSPSLPHTLDDVG